MKINLPKKVKQIIKNLEEKGVEIYIVGGAVRDILMAKLVYDWDFTTNATPDTIQKLFPDSFYDNKFGTVGIPSEVEGERSYEITTFRTEHGYSDARRPDKVEWGKTLEEDLKRRDFTINAMALRLTSFAQSKPAKHSSGDRLVRRSLGKGGVDSRGADAWNENEAEVELIDLYAGKKDLDNKLIRAVGDPNERFSEDALRMMRAVRIASELNFKIQPATLTAIQKNVSLIAKIARERVRDELLKILSSPHAYQGMTLFRETGLMEKILPEMQQTFGVDQKSPGRHHIHDVGTHLMLSLKHVLQRNPDPITRFATLIHDIGKPHTKKVLENGVITFYNHEMVSAKIARRIAARLKFSKKQSEKLYKLVRWHQFSVDETQTDSALRRFIRNVGVETVLDILDLRVGDRLGGGARETSWRLEEFKKRLIEVQKQPFTVHDLKISGFDVMEAFKIPPGPKVGEVLEKLYKEVVEKKIENEKDALLKRLGVISKPHI
ncbi:hypothetical protein A2686_02230 [Candidatus Woesebacteria bacterium RIFCSPHIGHO2_01_FULL_38_10]|uniref:HD domain-containing protein n=1 Tax=Candidatus Woesebacteria bacterium RIFCSPLOWO2_01_FULL_39_10b TaxID=1802517 RepID=A0A1F8BBP3_9BACT|nr:MAG: hypothetical protein A2686_02230 [Candidatus Woesebacteria bacterium RIFCSPHIGHO2_01_FULL_38_10]OGM60795.1 MAG: hypothetical protein A2892_02000 [Candidatus Woesebacteria bacterium RIFCSPLOWO2_01_FULL_39_10b]